MNMYIVIHIAVILPVGSNLTLFTQKTILYHQFVVNEDSEVVNKDFLTIIDIDSHKNYNVI